MPPESLKARKARTKKIVARLRKAFPDADCALEHSSALELLVATILAAQCTDARVNIITRDLFSTYRTPDDYAKADPKAFEKEIQSAGFYRQKTQSILGACRAIVEQHDGEVPDTMEELTELPGVARKTANVVLGTWFGKNEGIVVDTHVGRVTMRLKLAPAAKDSKDAVKIERALMELVARKDWTWFGHAMTHHGRGPCTARKPHCPDCPLNALCPSAGKV